MRAFRISAFLLLLASPALAQVNSGTSPLTGAKGGTNNAFMQFTGPATSIKTYSLPNSSDTISTLAAVQTFTAAKTFNDLTLILAGASSGTTTLKASSSASGVLTLPAATDTIVGRATTDTLTNKTFDTAGAGNSFSINGLAATANTGTGSVVRATSPAITTPAISGSTVIASNSAQALVAGANATTNPQFQVDASASSVATGVKITGAAAGSRAAVSVLSSGTNEGLTIDAKGSGLINIGSLSTGGVSLTAGTGGLAFVLGSDATGDIYYRNSSGFVTRLPVGSNTNVLTLSGGVPSWQAASSSASVTVGTTAVNSCGTSNGFLYNNGGTLGCILTTPTTQVFLSGSGTYTPTSASVRWIEVEMCGGAGGGAGSGGAGATAGTNGGDTTFSTFTAGKGSAPASQTAPGAGGTASGGYLNQAGGAGGTGSGATTANPGGTGGISAYGGAGPSGSGGAGVGGTATTNSCSGGGGGGVNVTANGGGGGGAGGFLKGIIANPGSLSYAVGTAGAAGSAGTGGAAGGAGSLGRIAVTEHYGP